MNEHPKDAEDIFLGALDKGTPQERGSYIEGACGGTSSFFGAYLNYWTATRNRKDLWMHLLPVSRVRWTGQRSSSLLPW